MLASHCEAEPWPDELGCALAGVAAEERSGLEVRATAELELGGGGAVVPIATVHGPPVVSTTTVWYTPAESVSTPCVWSRALVVM
jgi:hypothetical protein